MTFSPLYIPPDHIPAVLLASNMAILELRRALGRIRMVQ